MTLLAFSFWQWIIGLGMVFCCLLLILIILGQPGSSGGLAGAFGGGGGAAFGARTGDAFTWITVSLALLFLFLAVIGNYTYQPRTGPSLIVATPATDAGGDEAAPESSGETEGDAESGDDGATP